jgi:HPt (histidine-containing phosphotransfer) domain-containing protein
MRRDFSDPSVVERFARDFCGSLMGKIDRLDGRLQDDDVMGAEDAALSLTTSAAMVGAVRLAQAAGATQRSISAGSLEDARRSLARLRACGTDTVSELQDGYPEHR